MKKINLASKLILDKLWEMAETNDGYYKLNNDETFMPLTVEKLEKTVISLCHYGEQNGDLMKRPRDAVLEKQGG